MKKIKIFISSIFFVVVLLICNNVKATNITVSPSEPKVGDEVTITISVPNVHTSSVTANISGVVSGKIKVVGGDLAGNVSNYSNSAKFKCDKEGKINRATNIYGIDKNKAEKEINKINKLRANHYKYYTEKEWRDPSNYDICINSDSIGVEEAAKLICNMVKEKATV